MASVVAGRRTQSSYPDFLATTDASDITLSTYGIGNASATNYSPKVAAAIARLPGVKRVESWVGVVAFPLEADGAPDLALGNDVNSLAARRGCTSTWTGSHPCRAEWPTPGRSTS